MAPEKGPKLPLCRLFSDTYKISKVRVFPKPFCRPWDGFGGSFGDNTGTWAPRGTHVVATAPVEPEPWAPQKLQICCLCVVPWPLVCAQIA